MAEAVRYTIQEASTVLPAENFQRLITDHADLFDILPDEAVLQLLMTLTPDALAQICRANARFRALCMDKDLVEKLRQLRDDMTHEAYVHWSILALSDPVFKMELWHVDEVDPMFELRMEGSEFIRWSSDEPDDEYYGSIFRSIQVIAEYDIDRIRVHIYKHNKHPQPEMGKIPFNFIKLGRERGYIEGPAATYRHFDGPSVMFYKFSRWFNESIDHQRLIEAEIKELTEMWENYVPPRSPEPRQVPIRTWL